MKRRIVLIATLFFLLLCGGVWAKSIMVVGGPVVSSGGGSTSYCTGAATCTASTPGQCDVLCEDFEGSSYCVGTSGDQKCRNTWTAFGAIGTIDWTTAHSGTFSCNDKGANALQFTMTADTEYGYYIDAGADKGLSYVQFYMNIVSETISNHSAIFWATSNSDVSAAPYMLAIYDDAGTLHLRFIHSDSATYVTGTTALSTGTWYRVGITYNRTGGTAAVTLNGATEINVASGVTGSSPRRFFIGNLGGFINGESLTMQLDNIAVDDDTIQGACN